MRTRSRIHSLRRASENGKTSISVQSDSSTTTVLIPRGGSGSIRVPIYRISYFPTTSNRDLQK